MKSGLHTSTGSVPGSTAAWQRALYPALTILAWLAVSAVIVWLLSRVTHALVVVILAVIVTFALAPLIALLKRWLKRRLAIAAAYFVGVAIVVGIGTLLVITAAGEVANLVSNLPEYVGQIKNLGPQALVVLGPFGVTNETLQDLSKQLLANLQVAGTALAAGSLSLVEGIASTLIDAVLVLMLSIYMTLDGSRALTWLRKKTPVTLRHYVYFILDVAHQVVGGYVRGSLTMALLVGILVGSGLAILGIPYAVLLGVLAFFMAFIPVVGVFISGAISLLISLPKGPGITAAVLGYFIVVHVIADDVVGPRIMGKAVGIHPATGIIALLAGTELFGVWGALFGAPLAGLLQTIIVGIWRVHRTGSHVGEHGKS